MSEKTKIIAEMLAMQKKFIATEQSDGVDAEDYYSQDETYALNGYQAKYNELANRLVEIAHEEKGSHR